MRVLRFGPPLRHGGERGPEAPEQDDAKPCEKPPLRLRFPSLYIRLSEALTRADMHRRGVLAINYIGKYALERK